MADNIDHDQLFKELISTFFVEFIELFTPDIAADLDPTSLVPINTETFSDLITGERFNADVVMQVKFKKEDWSFLIHVENQSTSEPDFNYRMYHYSNLLLHQYRKPVFSIVVFSFDRPLRAEPNKFEVTIGKRRITYFRYEVVQLNRKNWRSFLKKPNPIASALMAKMKIEPKDRVRVKLECLRMLAGLNLDAARSYLIWGFVDTYLKLNMTELQKFEEIAAKQLPPEEKEVVMKLPNMWEEKGIEIGREQGVKQGKSLILIELLDSQVGKLEPNLQTRIQNLSEENLSVLVKDFSSLNSIADITKWLEQHETK